jgi:aldehyde:ferredoxin oxidoreductase
MLDDYYRVRGWDVETGIPEDATFSRLGLDEMIPDLDRARSGR